MVFAGRVGDHSAGAGLVRGRPRHVHVHLPLLPSGQEAQRRRRFPRRSRYHLSSIVSSFIFFVEYDLLETASKASTTCSPAVSSVLLRLTSPLCRQEQLGVVVGDDLVGLVQLGLPPRRLIRLLCRRRRRGRRWWGASAEERSVFALVFDIVYGRHNLDLGNLIFVSRMK